MAIFHGYVSHNQRVRHAKISTKITFWLANLYGRRLPFVGDVLVGREVLVPEGQGTAKTNMAYWCVLNVGNEWVAGGCWDYYW